MTILVLWAASKYFVRTDCFSNKDGVSLRLCNVEELVLSGPCFADVNVETVTHIPSKSGSFINGYLDFFVVLQSRSS